MEEVERIMILSYTEDLKNARTTWEQFYDCTGVIRRKYQLNFERESQLGAEKLRQALGVTDLSEVVIGGQRIFENMKP